MREIFKDIPTYEGIYQVSNLGRVKALKRKFSTKELIKYQKIRGRYYSIKLMMHGKTKYYYTHQLVAMTFLNHIPKANGLVVDHIDNNPLNNSLSNLQVITIRENNSKDRVGVSEYTGVSWDKSVSRWYASIGINGKQKYLGRYSNEIDASNAYQSALKELNKEVLV